MNDETLTGLYKFCEEKSKNIKLKAEPQVFVELCNALEELRLYRDKPEGWLYTQAEQNGYNKAIDDYCNRLCDNGSIADFMKDYFRDVAKELKSGE